MKATEVFQKDNYRGEIDAKIIEIAYFVMLVLLNIERGKVEKIAIKGL